MKSKKLTDKRGRVRELTAKDMRRMKPAAEVLSPELLKILPKKKVGERGPQKSPIKISVTVRYSPEVIKYFKGTGKGWQKRMDAALKQWIKKHPHAA